MASELSASMSRRIQRDEISAEKRLKASARVAQWEADSKNLLNPMVRIKAMLGEAAKQELARIKSYHDKYLESLEKFKFEQLTAHTQIDTETSNDQVKRSRVKSEARLNQRLKTLADGAAAKAHSLAVDVLISYKRLILECVATNERMAAEARREGKSAAAIAADEEYLATHAMMLHSSLFPWRDGILFECPSAEMRSQVLAKGWAAVGRSGRLQFHTFAASTVVSQLKQAPVEEKRRIVAEANQRLQEFLQEEAQQAKQDNKVSTPVPEYDCAAHTTQGDSLMYFPAADSAISRCALLSRLSPVSSYSSDDMSGGCGVSDEMDDNGEFSHLCTGAD